MLKRVLLGGLAAGFLDIVYALIAVSFKGVTPMVLLQSVASGLYGGASFQGGWNTALQGLLLHFLMAILIAAIFVAAYERLAFLRQRTLMWGGFYGLVVFVGMRVIVFPLSAIGSIKFPHGWMLYGELFSHIVFVGLVIAYFARRDSTETA